MAGAGLEAKARAAPARLPEEAQLTDLRFRALLGAKAWASLPAAVQERFSHRLSAGQALTYKGEITGCRMNACGWLLAQFCRLVGAPLPLGCDIGLAAVVTVTEDGRSGGQVWSRIYARGDGFPQVIQSVKRFAGPTGLEEYLGRGLGIALTVHAGEAGISFCSDHYFIAIGRVRFRLPGWIGPGALRIDHVDCGAGRFEFILSLRHRLMGEMIHQVGLFHDQPA